MLKIIWSFDEGTKTRQLAPAKSSIDQNGISEADLISDWSNSLILISYIDHHWHPQTGRRGAERHKIFTNTTLLIDVK